MGFYYSPIYAFSDLHFSGGVIGRIFQVILLLIENIKIEKIKISKSGKNFT